MGFYFNGKWFDTEEEAQKEENDFIRKIRREKVNGPDPIVDEQCDCGAKHDRHFPNMHYTWCKVHWKYPIKRS